MLRFSEKEAWNKTPYQITKLFKYHKEYNSLKFENGQSGNRTPEQIDDIDKALGGL